MKAFFQSALRSFAAALACAALSALSIALMLALYDIPRTVEMAVLLWAGLLFAQSLVCELLSSRSLSALLYVLFNGVLLFLGGEQIVSHSAFLPASSGFPVMLRICVYLSGVVCAYAAQKEPGSNAFVRLGDVLIAALGGYMATVFALHEGINMPVSLLALCALITAMLVSAMLRAGGESDSVIRGTGTGGCLVLGALLFLCLLLAGGLLTLTSGRVDGLVSLFLLLWDKLSAVLLVVVTVFARFIAMIFGNPRMMERQAVFQEESPAYPSGSMEAMGTAPQWVVYLVMGVIAAVILAAVLALLWALRGTKLGRTRRKKARRSVTRKSHALSTLLALWRALTDRVAFELLYRANRHTPQGLYVLAVRIGRIKRLPKRKSESAGAYIRRLHAILLAQTGLSTLDRLADMLDHALYSSAKPHLSRGEADDMAVQLRSIAAPPLIQTDKTAAGSTASGSD